MLKSSSCLGKSLKAVSGVWSWRWYRVYWRLPVSPLEDGCLSRPLAFNVPVTAAAGDSEGVRDEEEEKRGSGFPDTKASLAPVSSFPSSLFEAQHQKNPLPTATKNG